MSEMPRRSERDRIATTNQLKIEGALLNLQRELEVTDVEFLQALNSAAASTLKYMLRMERHGDYDSPAGLEKEPKKPKKSEKKGCFE